MHLSLKLKENLLKEYKNIFKGNSSKKLQKEELKLLMLVVNHQQLQQLQLFVSICMIGGLVTSKGDGYQWE
jgi:hypothetical protein